MLKTIDRTCFWEGFGERGSNFKWESVCHIRIYEEGEQSVVVASDVADPVAYPNGTGTSITNCVENLVRLVYERFGLDPERLVWHEHYPPRPNEKYRLQTAEFSLVRLT